MALTNGSQISVVLSGGTNNLDPNLALGGNPSAAPIVDDVLDNLFDDVTPDQSSEGYEDYRCIYFFNDGDTTVFNVKVWLEDFEEGAVIETGVSAKNETQRIQIAGTPTSGSLTLAYEGIEFEINYQADLGAWALALQDSLNALEDGDGNRLLRNVLVTGQNAGGNILFDLLFADQDGNRDHPTLDLVTNALSPSLEVVISALQEGSPINTIAPQITNEIVPPGGVAFFTSTLESPVSIPKLRPGEGFPIWFRRIAEAGTVAVANDGFELKFRAESLDPEE